MIYTVTFNPSLDYYVRVTNIKTGAVNRTAGERMAVGGKGINVSLELKEMGEPTRAYGFVGGFVGDYIKKTSQDLGLDCVFLDVEGTSRINVKIKSDNETDINGEGPKIEKEDVSRLVDMLKPLLKEDDWLVVCGSVPSALGDGAYADFLEALCPPCKTVVDAGGKLLVNTLAYRPFLIKPNVHEVCEIFGLPGASNVGDLYVCAKNLRAMGAENVLISMGAAGAVMATGEGEPVYVKAPQGEVSNSVGAGDAMIAGFIHKFVETGDMTAALRYSVATGSAAAFSSTLASREQIEFVEKMMA